MFKIRIVCLFLLLIAGGCQTVQEKNLALIKDRSEKLKPLSTWRPTWCRLETRLTQPAIARYREMFPDETEKLTQESWAYTWKARKTSCEVSPLQRSEMSKSHQAFLETAMCMLLQVHWVNSPFAELVAGPDDILSDGGRVHIRASTDQDLGIYLDPSAFVVETKTKSRGTLKASYHESENEWLPDRLEQRLPKSVLVVDALEYDTARVGRRRMLKSFWISVGEEKAMQHTQVFMSGCQNY
jgi:hypothetical protein